MVTKQNTESAPQVVKSSPVTKLVPGAGVVNVLVAGKRIKSMHRSIGGGASLKWFARNLASLTAFENHGRASVAKQWLANKGIRP